MIAVVVMALVYLVVMAILLGWSLLVGFALTQVFDFSLFEGSILGSLSTAMSFHFLNTLIRTPPIFPEIPDYEYDYDDTPIHEKRFIESDKDRTWKNFLRFSLANDIFMELEEQENVIMPEPQLQELAIRLADISVAILEKLPRRQRYKIAISDFKKQMQGMDMQPYDDDILCTTRDVVNMQLTNPRIYTIVRQKEWDSPAKPIELMMM